MVFKKPVCNSGKIAQKSLVVILQTVLVFNGESAKSRYPDQNNFKFSKVQSLELFIGLIEKIETWKLRSRFHSKWYIPMRVE